MKAIVKKIIKTYLKNMIGLLNQLTNMKKSCSQLKTYG